MAESPVTSPEERAQLRAARRHVEAVKGFYVHAGIYLIVNIGLVIINAATSTRWWAHWPVLGWGVFLVGHWFAVYRPIRLFSAAWEQKRVDSFVRGSKNPPE